jgi:molybdopterin-guanine dinucleotide biosynthesis protein B
MSFNGSVATKRGRAIFGGFVRASRDQSLHSERGVEYEEWPMRVIGFAGWSGAGKTTLIVKLIPALNRQGLSVSTIKHAHHNFDLDQPGKDSYEHRAAGAEEVLVASANRVALMRELRGAPEPSLSELLRLMKTVDLVLVEGFKRDPLPKIEIFRTANGKPPLYPQDRNIVAVLSDDGAPSGGLPYASIDDIPAAADLVLANAQPVATVLAEFEGRLLKR